MAKKIIKHKKATAPRKGANKKYVIIVAVALFVIAGIIFVFTAGRGGDDAPAGYTSAPSDNPLVYDGKSAEDEQAKEDGKRFLWKDEERAHLFSKNLKLYVTAWSGKFANGQKQRHPRYCDSKDDGCHYYEYDIYDIPAINNDKVIIIPFTITIISSQVERVILTTTLPSGGRASDIVKVYVYGANDYQRITEMHTTWDVQGTSTKIGYLEIDTSTVDYRQGFKDALEYNPMRYWMTWGFGTDRENNVTWLFDLTDNGINLKQL